MAEENPLAGYSDDGLVAEAWSQGARQGVFAIEMTRRLMNATVKQSRAAENVGNKIWWLNFWLLVFTVVIAAMTACGRAGDRRPPVAPLAPHQPRPARDAAYALEY